MRKAVGLHVNSGRNDAGLAAYIRAVRPSVMKWLTDGMGDGSMIRLAKQHGALTIGRVYVPEAEQGLDGARQDRMLALVKEAAARWPDIDAWEGFNECFQGAEHAAERAGFDLRLMELCRSIGRRAVIGSFSVGQPQLDNGTWRGYLPALRAAAAGGHFVGLHEYGGPAMQWGAGANQAGGLVGGRWVNIDPATRPGVDGWFALRYRKALAEWRRLGLATVPKIVITETGLDDIQPRPDVGARSGFLSYQDTDYWNHPILGMFADGLAWQSERWAEDDAIVGGVVFCWADASGKWGAFDLADDAATLGRVIDKMRALPVADKPETGGGAMATFDGVLRAALPAGGYQDLRGRLPENNGGPNGPFGSRAPGQIDTIAIHHTAGSRDSTAEQLAAMHINSRGWAGLGYHVLIRRGVVYYVGDVGQARACCLNQNHRVICVCLTGDYESVAGDALALEDRAALFAVVAAIQSWAGSALGRQLAVKGHGEIQGQATACPGARLRAVLPALAAGQAGPRPPATPPASPAAAALVAASKAAQAAAGVRLNETAALQRAIRADGLTVTTNEARLSVGGVTYAWQRAEPLTGGRGWVYYCPVGEWGQVKRLPE